jgi:hypothetical protein
MRLLLASLAAVTAVAFAAPAFAQDTPPAPTPAVKHVKHKTSCSALKSESAKATCLKRAHAHATKPHHKKTKRVASKAPAAPRVAPTDSVPAAQSAPSPSPSQPIAVPPLPQKTL